MGFENHKAAENMTAYLIGLSKQARWLGDNDAEVVFEQNLAAQH